jgi:hypothetical protein
VAFSFLFLSSFFFSPHVSDKLISFLIFHVLYFFPIFSPTHEPSCTPPAPPTRRPRRRLRAACKLPARAFEPPACPQSSFSDLGRASSDEDELLLSATVDMAQGTAVEPPLTGPVASGGERRRRSTLTLAAMAIETGRLGEMGLGASGSTDSVRIVGFIWSGIFP